MVDPSSLMPCCRSRDASSCVSVLRSFTYEDFGDSSPSQIQETPSCTSSSMLYWRIAFADENTYSDQLLRPCFIRSSSCRARLRFSRKFSSIMKKDETLIERMKQGRKSWSLYVFSSA